MREPSEVPALLTMPHYTGTLAAARCLGAHKVPLLLATNQLLAPATWSRHIRARYLSPAVSSGPAAIRDWLVQFGAKRPGTLLYPTSDDMAFTISRYASELEPYFHLYSPPLAVIKSLLDKAELFLACTRLGIPCPATYFPRNAEAVALLAANHAQMIVKPRSQVFFISGAKGEICSSPEALVRAWNFHNGMYYAAGIRESMPDIDLPILQEYVPATVEGTYSISGFADRSGTLHGLRASTKVVQFPPKVGVGYYFVEAPLDEVAVQSIRTLCRDLGFFGVFEVEFVRSGSQRLMVDFNPRYYGQMAFDIARGSPHPWLVQHAALGREAELPDVLERAGRSSRKPVVYCHRIALTWNAVSSLMVGKSSLGDAHRAVRDASCVRGSVDAAIDPDDMAPAWASGAAVVLATVYRPRAIANKFRHYVGALSRSHNGRATPAPSAPAPREIAPHAKPQARKSG